MAIRGCAGPETMMLPPPAQVEPCAFVRDTATAIGPAFGGGLGGGGSMPVQRASKPCNHSRTSCRCTNWVDNGVDLCGACYSGHCNA